MDHPEVAFERDSYKQLSEALTDGFRHVSNNNDNPECLRNLAKEIVTLAEEVQRTINKVCSAHCASESR